MSPVTTSPGNFQRGFKLRAKTRMLELDLTVTDVAAKVGCSRTAASQAINHGLHEPTRRKIAAALGITP